MNKLQIVEKIKKLAAKELKIPVNSTALKSSLVLDLGLDSLSVVEFIMAIEETFSIKFPLSAESNLNTLQDVINYTLEIIDNPAKLKSETH